MRRLKHGWRRAWPAIGAGGLVMLGMACAATSQGATGVTPSPRPQVTFSFTTQPPATRSPTTPPSVTASPSSSVSASPSVTPEASPSCPDSPLLGIYNPDAFSVLDSCVWFNGIVVSAVEQRDLDWQLNVRPDPGFEDFLNAANESDAGGSMVVQIIPGQNYRIPDPGEHIYVFGTWVHNLNAGWNEMHPVFSIMYSLTGVRVDSVPPREPQFSPSG